MKKIFLFILLLLFIPLFVNAETCDMDKISIESIQLSSKSDNIDEKSQPVINGMSIDLNLLMKEVGDTIEYKMIIKNASSEDYEFDKTSVNVDSDYIKYSFKTSDDSKIIKAGEEKEIILSVQYSKKVDDDDFVDGVYTDSKNIEVNLSGDNTVSKSNTISNPKTERQMYIVISIIIIISILICIILKKNKNTKLMALIIGMSIILPIGVCAICKGNIKVNSSVEIVQHGEFCVIPNYFYSDYCPTEAIHYYTFDYGDTFGEYFDKNPDSDLIYTSGERYNKINLNGYGFMPKSQWGNYIKFYTIENICDGFSYNYNDLNSKILPKEQGCYKIGFDDGLL